MSKPLLIDLYCGLGGWAEGGLAAGYDVVGFDIEQHVYGASRYPAQLVLQDARTLHGSQFRHAALIVASPPCQRYSYMAMPFSRGKRLAAEIRADETGEKLRDLNELFETCFRLQREANEAVRNHCVHCGFHLLSHHRWCGCECARFEGGTRYIPMVVENVKGAQPWVGRAAWHYGSYYLWGDVPALMPATLSRPKFIMDDIKNHQRRQVTGLYVNGSFVRCICPSVCDCQNPEPGDDGVALVSNACPVHNMRPEVLQDCYAENHQNGGWRDSEVCSGLKNSVTAGGSWFNVAHGERIPGNQAGAPQRGDGLKVSGIKLSEVGFNVAAAQRYRESDAVKGYIGGLGRGHGRDPASACSSRSDSRKAASAQIAKIPFDLAYWIAKCYLPHQNGERT